MLKVILLSVFVPFCLAATTVAPNDVVDVLASRSTESTLVELVKAAGLVDVLKQGGPYTIFAPTDYAFQKLGLSVDALKADPQKLGEILKYHVVNGIYKLTDLHVNELMLDSLAGSKIRVNYYFTARRHVTAEGSLVTRSNIMASNGVIHIVNDVMMPPVGSIIDVLSSDGNFSTLVDLARQAGLVEALQEGPYTLMAPTNDAFASLGDDTINKLKSNPDLLKKVLLYHVIPGTIYSDGMHSGYLHTLDEEDRERISASFFGTVHIDGLTSVVKADMSATNGVVHTINHVLVPAHVKTALASL